MPALISALGVAFCVMAVGGAAYCAFATLLVWRFMARPRPRIDVYPKVTIIKPLHGAHPGLGEALESFCAQDYPGEVHIVFGVQDAADPAIALVRSLQQRHPGLDIALVINSRLYGANRKISNLINIAARARHEVLVLSDADIRVAPGYLRTVVGALAQDRVGAVSCLYVGVGRQDLWSRLSAMAIDYQFLPSAVLGKTMGLAQPCFGSTVAIDARVLEEIGGFEAMVDHLADDYEIGRAVRAKGYRIAMPPIVVSHLCTESSARELVDHELRWGCTVKRIDFQGYLGSVITHPFPLALLGGAFLGFPTFAVGLILGILVLRVGLRAFIDAATGANAGTWWLVPLRDVLSFAVFLASFAVNTVGWQGRRFRVSRDGVLSHT